MTERCARRPDHRADRRRSRRSSGPAPAPVRSVARRSWPLRLAGPSVAHPFGLDELGRDILARVLAGARISFLVGLAVVSVSAIVGMLLGAIAGYFGGRVDDRRSAGSSTC